MRDVVNDYIIITALSKYSQVIKSLETEWSSDQGRFSQSKFLIPVANTSGDMYVTTPCSSCMMLVCRP